MIPLQFSEDKFDGVTQYARNKRVQVSKKLMFNTRRAGFFRRSIFAILITGSIF